MNQLSTSVLGKRSALQRIANTFKGISTTETRVPLRVYVVGLEDRILKLQEDLQVITELIAARNRLSGSMEYALHREEDVISITSESSSVTELVSCPSPTTSSLSGFNTGDHSPHIDSSYVFLGAKRRRSSYVPVTPGPVRHGGQSILVPHQLSTQVVGSSLVTTAKRLSFLTTGSLNQQCHEKSSLRSVTGTPVLSTLREDIPIGIRNKSLSPRTSHQSCGTKVAQQWRGE